jgi:Fe(II)/alpha-ketoglutarate-dependent arginine beta-hydroxylase
MTMQLRYTLDRSEVDAINSVAKRAASEHGSPEDSRFLNNAQLYAHELPRPVRAFLSDFRLSEPKNGYCVISGYPVDEAKIGPTPSHWKERREPLTTVEEEMLLILFGSLLGDVIAWSTQQSGFIVHNIMPIKADEDEQLGTGSKQLLSWHNEDAFHPFRGDYIGMMCLRNPDQVATTIACVDKVDLSNEQKALLFENHYMIHPDESHLKKNRGTVAANSPQEEKIEASYQGIEKMRTEAQKVAVLFGGIDSPYLRVDPYFMPRVEHQGAQEALDELIAAVDASIEEVVLQPGDYLFVDNFRAVHGRKPFNARYDGVDRWLTRINIARDLRKSRSARKSCTSRVIF